MPVLHTLFLPSVQVSQTSPLSPQSNYSQNGVLNTPPKSHSPSSNNSITVIGSNGGGGGGSIIVGGGGFDSSYSSTAAASTSVIAPVSALGPQSTMHSPIDGVIATRAGHPIQFVLNDSGCSQFSPMEQLRQQQQMQLHGGLVQISHMHHMQQQVRSLNGRERVIGRVDSFAKDNV